MIDITYNRGEHVDSFGRIYPFRLTTVSDEQMMLAKQFAEQSSRFGWPVTFPEPQVTPEGCRYPILHFWKSGMIGYIEYQLDGWTPLPVAKAKPDAKS